MSIERTPTGDYRVRWRDEGGRHRARVVGRRKADAEALDQDMKRAKRLGMVHLLGGDQRTLDELANEWWRRHARTRAIKTQKGYAWILDRYLSPRFGAYKLRSIRTAEVDEWMGDMADDHVGLEARRKALKLLRQLLDKAVAWDYLPNNPASFAEMPQTRSALVIPPTLAEVEAIRGQLLDQGKARDAAIVCLMAYAGLRPHELVELLWSDIQENAIRVRAQAKIGARGRSVTLLKPLATDLQHLRSVGSRDMIIFPNGAGRQWSQTTFNNWRSRTFKKAAPGQRPYNLRHTFVSLLIAEGKSVPEVAKQAGHGQELCLRTYSHLWDEYQKAGSADEAIWAARRTCTAAHAGATLPASEPTGG